MMCVEVSQADVVQVEHPWLFSWVKRHFPEKPIVLVEHNIETVTYQTLNACSLVNDRSIVKIVRTIESDAVRQADLIFCCSQEDRQNLAQYFDINPSIVNIVPNPVNVKKYVPVKNKSVLKSQLGFGNKTLILFAGSKHPPNQEALRIIEDKIAPAFEKRKDILFVVVGHVSKKKQEKNIYYTGFVKDVLPYYQAADLAIIPLVSGTGTSLKTLEFMSCALPVISTRVGSRGLKTRSNKELIIVNIESFPRQIRQLLKNPEFANKIGICGRKHVLKEFSNETVTAKMDRLYSLV